MKQLSKSIGVGLLSLAVSLLGFGGSIALAADYTLSEVSAHNTASDCWLVISGQVYDVTTFIPIHPGGNAILAYCGEDATSIFDAIHNPTAFAMLPPYLIGTLITEQTELPILTRVTLAPATASITVGNTLQLKASPKNQKGGAFSGATTTFSSDNSGIASVNSSGLVSGVSVGSATITATSVSGDITVSDTSTITVTTSSVGNDNEENEIVENENDGENEVAENENEDESEAIESDNTNESDETIGEVEEKDNANEHDADNEIIENDTSDNDTEVENDNEQSTEVKDNEQEDSDKSNEIENDYRQNSFDVAGNNKDNYKEQTRENSDD
jgi:predicted heme/steroid binding protein